VLVKNDAPTASALWRLQRPQHRFDAPVSQDKRYMLEMEGVNTYASGI
jgi:hypothetical protein